MCAARVQVPGYSRVGQQRGASLLSSLLPESVCACARVRVRVCVC